MQFNCYGLLPTPFYRLFNPKINTFAERGLNDCHTAIPDHKHTPMK